VFPFVIGSLSLAIDIPISTKGEIIGRVRQVGSLQVVALKMKMLFRLRRSMVFWLPLARGRLASRRLRGLPQPSGTRTFSRGERASLREADGFWVNGLELGAAAILRCGGS
jgi:hypothetical protein